MGASLEGFVAEFEEAAGLGVVESVDRTRYLFHCIDLSDGSRSVELLQRVEFEVVLRFGRYEARHIRKL